MNGIGMESGLNPAAIWPTAVALLAFGAAYNALVMWAGRRGYTDGYTWLLVVIGVAVTILAAGFTIGWTTVAVLFLYFAASGLPMAAGDIARHVRARRAEHE